MACTQTQVLRERRDREEGQCKTPKSVGVCGIDAAVVGDASDTWGWPDAWARNKLASSGCMHGGG